MIRKLLLDLIQKLADAHLANAHGHAPEAQALGMEETLHCRNGIEDASADDFQVLHRFGELGLIRQLSSQHFDH